MVAVRSIGVGLVSAIWATPVPLWVAGTSPAMTNEGLAMMVRDRS
jgi:hypothetical protein